MSDGSAKQAGEPGEASPGVRWWPAVVIVALFAVEQAGIWSMGEWADTFRSLASVCSVLLTGLLLLGWFLLAGRFPPAIRGRGLSVLAALTVLFFARYRFEGFSGDMTPQFRLATGQPRPPSTCRTRNKSPDLPQLIASSGGTNTPSTPTANGNGSEQSPAAADPAAKPWQQASYRAIWAPIARLP